MIDQRRLRLLAHVVVQYAPDVATARRALEEALVGLSLADTDAATEAGATNAWVPDADVEVANEEIIRIIFTAEDVKGIAADNDIDFDVALDRASEWAKHIADTASGLCSQQLESVILTNQP